MVNGIAQKPIEDFGLLPLPLGPAAFVERNRKDLALNADLMRRAGIVPE